MDYNSIIEKYSEQLAKNKITAKTFFKNNDEKRIGKSGIVNDFPKNPGGKM